MATVDKQYQRREPYFANRVIRAMAKTCLANEIGPDAVWLVTVIAMTEDSARYRGPVTFYNEQLMPILGFKYRDRLYAARDRAVQAGWLVVLLPPKGSRMAAKYYATIPEDCSELDDAPLGEGSWSGSLPENPAVNPPQSRQCSPPEGDTCTNSQQEIPAVNPPQCLPCSAPEVSSEADTCTKTQPEIPAVNQAMNRAPFLPIPNPELNTPPNPPSGGNSLAAPPEGKKRKPANPPPSPTEQAQIDRLYQAYPCHVGKPKAVDAILKALRAGADFQVLRTAVEAFALAVRAPPLVDWSGVPHPATWFNQRRWEDDPESWKQVGRRGREYEARAEKFKKNQAHARNENANGTNPFHREKTVLSEAPPTGDGGGKSGENPPEAQGPVEHD